MRDNPKPFEIFKHFKGKQYQILALAKDAGDGRSLVVYQALYGDYIIYVRDLSEFMSPVDKVKYPEASQEYRFERQSGTAVTGEEQDNRQEPVQKTENDTVQSAANIPGKDADRTVDKASGEPSGNFLDPEVEAFLDAESVYEKLNILAGLRHRITDDMLDIMAAASDIELNKGSTQERYAELKNCLLMTEMYERKRI